ncbi:hypothetical protein [Bacillus sp. 005/A4HT-01/001]|uniref:hypothetical protein n=1 Tax=Bacillus sp. 005/A4HT-01/001 TaxID=2509010 RepID=UPI001074BE6E|nr:hypothetical protein [Bacillus sp. 005/A4HT-01/001]TFW49238.1 hypothetical protein ES896_02130 [Bacillus sp. 005/A4HT-01/001]
MTKLPPRKSGKTFVHTERFELISEYAVDFIALRAIVYRTPIKTTLRWANKNVSGLWVNLGWINEEEYDSLERAVAEMIVYYENVSRNEAKRKYRRIAKTLKEAPNK